MAQLDRLYHANVNIDSNLKMCCYRGIWQVDGGNARPDSLKFILSYTFTLSTQYNK